MAPCEDPARGGTSTSKSQGHKKFVSGCVYRDLDENCTRVPSRNNISAHRPASRGFPSPHSPAHHRCHRRQQTPGDGEVHHHAALHRPLERLQPTPPHTFRLRHWHGQAHAWPERRQPRWRPARPRASTFKAAALACLDGRSIRRSGCMVRGMGLYARCRPSAVAKTMHLRRREPSLHQLMRRSLASAQARLS